MMFAPRRAATSAMCGALRLRGSGRTAWSQVPMAPPDSILGLVEATAGPCEATEASSSCVAVYVLHAFKLLRLAKAVRLSHRLSELATHLLLRPSVLTLAYLILAFCWALHVLACAFWRACSAACSARTRARAARACQQPCLPSPCATPLPVPDPAPVSL